MQKVKTFYFNLNVESAVLWKTIIQKKLKLQSDWFTTPYLVIHPNSNLLYVLNAKFHIGRYREWFFEQFYLWYLNS